jgi:hypothetical protein
VFVFVWVWVFMTSEVASAIGMSGSVSQIPCAVQCICTTSSLPVVVILRRYNDQHYAPNELRAVPHDARKRTMVCNGRAMDRSD